MVNMENKKCTACNINKPIIDFYKNGDYFKSKCKECEKNHNNIYYNQNKKTHLQRCRDWQNENKDKQKQLSNKSYIKSKQSPDKIKQRYEYNKEYHKKQYANNTNFKIIRLLRTRFYNALEKNLKTESVIKLIGCSIEEFKQYIENKFLLEMDWENRGVVWEIDHIKPCASLDLTNIEQQKECFHYTNHQPLFKTTEIAEDLGYKNHIGNRNKKDNVL